MNKKTEEAKKQDQIVIPTEDGYMVLSSKDIHKILPDKASKRATKPGSESKLSILLYVCYAILVFGGSLSILALTGYYIAGYTGFLFLTVLGTFILILFPSVFRPKSTKSDDKSDFFYCLKGQALNKIVARLSKKANLSVEPVLFYDYSLKLNVYTIKHEDRSAIVLSRGLMNILDYNELMGILAHEIAHIQNSDMNILQTASYIKRIAGHLFLFGQILLLINIILTISSQSFIPWLLILLLIGFSVIAYLTGKAIIRKRKYQADSVAVLLTGDYEGLISGLKKIKERTPFWEFLLAFYDFSKSEILKEHPDINKRIRKLNLTNKSKNPPSSIS